MTGAARRRATCRVGGRTSGDLDVVTAANDVIELAFLPQVGGRLISCRYAGQELLWRNPAWLDGDLDPVRPPSAWPRPDGTMASWTNVGGNKTWPAPQGWDTDEQWHGPPDGVLDSGRYEVSTAVDTDGAAVVDLTSRPDPATGVQIRRTFRLAATGGNIIQTSTFVNRSPNPVTWSVWDVTQVDTGTGAGRFLVDVGSPAGPLHLFELVGRPTYLHERGRCVVPAQDVVGKLGFPGATGRLEWRRADGIVLELSTTRRAGRYPDGGCPVELWLQYPLPDPLPELGGLAVTARLVEMEVLSPLVTLPPGASTSLVTSWRCRRAGADHPPARSRRDDDPDDGRESAQVPA